MQIHPRTRSRWPAVLTTLAPALLAATLPAACTSHHANKQELEHQARTEQEPPPEPVSVESPGLDEPPAWRWIHRGDGGWSADIGPTGASSCHYEHDDEAHTPGKVCCESQASRWCVELHEDFVPGVSLASDGKTLFVADYPAISTGARFVAYELSSGIEQWTRQAQAIGPQPHSKYFNVVQLRLVDGSLIAYGNEAHGAYIEVMDPTTGELREHTRLTAPQVEWSWDESAPEPEPEFEQTLAGGGTCRFTSSEDGPSQLACTVPGTPGWTYEFESDFVGRGALISDGARVVMVTWCRMANGARARAFALADGTLLWDRPIEGIGPQDHNKYSNLIQLALDGELVVIRGNETHGHYAEAYALATGSLRWSIAWPAS